MNDEQLTYPTQDFSAYPGYEDALADGLFDEIIEDGEEFDPSDYYPYSGSESIYDEVSPDFWSDPAGYVERTIQSGVQNALHHQQLTQSVAGYIQHQLEDRGVPRDAAGYLAATTASVADPTTLDESIVNGLVKYAYGEWQWGQGAGSGLGSSFEPIGSPSGAHVRYDLAPGIDRDDVVRYARNYGFDLNDSSQKRACFAQLEREGAVVRR